MSAIAKLPCDEAVTLTATPSSGIIQGRWVLAATILGSSMAFTDGNRRERRVARLTDRIQGQSRRRSVGDRVILVDTRGSPVA